MDLPVDLDVLDDDERRQIDAFLREARALFWKESLGFNRIKILVLKPEGGCAEPDGGRAEPEGGRTEPEGGRAGADIVPLCDLPADLRHYVLTKWQKRHMLAMGRGRVFARGGR